jgi:hypothetical protein
MQEKDVVVDYTDKYCELIHSKNNKHVPFYRWYPFVEGFSGDFVKSVIRELNFEPRCCLDPFAGSGTTPLVFQENYFKCISFEINPFLFDLMMVKLRRDYHYVEINNLIATLRKKLAHYSRRWKYPNIETKTLFQRGTLNKWVLNREAVRGIIDVLEGIKTLDTSKKNKNLFRIALASILLKVSNVFRNGKCLSYKNNWHKQKVSREDVHRSFLEVCGEVILTDISSMSKTAFDNSKLCLKGDAKTLINDLKDETIDLVITSPPYLNSRDYTDVYRLELWMLGYLKTFADERKLRRGSLRSHVQINLPEEEVLDIMSLKKVIKDLTRSSKVLWNPNIVRMIKGYFVDLNNIMTALYKKLMTGGRVYIVVGNSFYNNVPVETDLILAEMSQNLGYEVSEVRIGRYTKTSGQQNSKKIRESVLVLQKK